ncbi:MAG TPA: pectate lyase [Longimicrobiaceae bacterium]|nr:pectate lyase [Longimicrobiaceae bacterium]
MRVRARWWALAVVAGFALLGCSAPARMAPVVPTPQDGRLLAPQRIQALPAGERQAWTAYLAQSHRLRALNDSSIAAEVRALGRSEWTPAPEGPSFVVSSRMTPEWFRGDSARHLADVIVSFQTPAGGWSKQVRYTGEPRQPGQGYTHQGRSYVGTFDNTATTEQMRFLSGAFRAHGDPRYRDAFLRGLEYVFRAQFPGGCWPQIYPLQGNYHDAATFNDDAMVRVLRLLREVAGGAHPFVPEAERQRARESLARGVECVLQSQVAVDGVRTVWGAQHDPLTLAPVRARAYEPASLAGRESAAITDFLMMLEEPDTAVAGAVHAAAAWFRKTAIHGMEYVARGDLTPREGAGPIWARFYEIGTDRPLFSNRDGVVRYTLAELEEERRTGYAWYTDEPATTLRRYERWLRSRGAARR